MPDLKYYHPNSMTPDRCKQLITWYTHEVNMKNTFCMAVDIVDYCVSDVTILREGCKQFQDLCHGLFDVDPFADSITIASFCQQVYRMHHMPEDIIAIIPQDHYRGRAKQSTIALRWLIWVAHTMGRDIKHARNFGEVKIHNYYVDGCHEATCTVSEFYGCFYHGCPKCYSPDTEIPLQRCTIGEVHTQTLDRATSLRQWRYQLVEIWECEYAHLLRTDADMATFVATLKIAEPLNVKMT